MKAYILLDRSGSMSDKWDETIGAINAYVQGLEKTFDVYVAVFDSASYDVIRNCSVPQYLQEQINSKEFLPRAYTPLYDSVGKIITQMIADNPSDAVLVIMTDGYENQSKEYTLEHVRKQLDVLKEKNYPVVFLGANFDDIKTVSATFGVASANTVSVSVQNMKSYAADLSSRTNTRAKSLAGSEASTQAFEYSDEEKAKWSS